jgi:hypothetical protein
MRHHLSAPVFLTCIWLMIFGCTSKQKESSTEKTDTLTAGAIPVEDPPSIAVRQSFKIKNSNVFFSTLDSLLEKLYACSRSGDEGCMLKINKHVEDWVLSITTLALFEKIHSETILSNAKYGFVVSSNRAVSVFSWNSQLGGSSPDYRNIILYKSESEVRGHMQENVFPFWCDRVDVLSVPDLYLIHGTGAASSIESYALLKGIRINSSGVQLVNLFPNETNADSALYIAYGVTDTPEFRLEENGRILLVPEEANDVSRSYQRFMFKGNSFVQTIPSEIRLAYMGLTAGDFKVIEPSGYFSGSEIPTEVYKGETVTSYTFADGLILEVLAADDEGSNAVTAQRQNQNEQLISMPVENLFSKGRIDDYVFFSGTGVPESTPLYIYHLGRKEFIYRGDCADVMIKGAKVVMKKRSRIRRDSCENTEGETGIWFDVFEMDYQQLPLVEQYTGATFCIYVE